MRRRHGCSQALRVLNEIDYYFPPELGEHLGLITPGGHPRTMVRPDLVVLPAGWDDGRLPQSRVLHTDDAHPVPVLIGEVLPHNTEDKDKANKRALYEALGVQECLLIDPGSPADGQDTVRPPSLELYRLQADGHYDLAATGAAVHSVACDTDLRMLPPRDMGLAPVFQWRDPETGRWRDQEADYAFGLTESRAAGHVEGRAEGHAAGHVEGGAEERLKLALHWTARGVPDNVDDLMFAVMAEPDRWRELLGLPPAPR